MPKGPKISDDIRQVIAEESLKDLGLQRKEVAVLIEKRLKDAGLTSPSFSTLIKRISEVRQPSFDDQAWTISIDDAIPYEIMGTLLKLQRWCLLIGSPLTVREARWASRLVNAVDDSKYLLEMAWRYSIREQIKSTYNELDTELCFPRRSPAGETIKRAAAKAGILQFMTREDFTGYEEPLPDFERKSPIWIERSMHIPIDLAMETKVFGEEIQMEHVETLTEELQELYALWLRIFAQSPGWDALKIDEKIRLAQRLRSELAGYGSVDESERSRNWVPSPNLLSALSLDKKE